MSPRLLIIVFAVGSAAGIAAHSLHTSRSGFIESAAAAPERAPGKTTSVSLSVREPRQLIGDEPRIARVLGALYQPVRLRQRHELFEALRDLDAKEVAALVNRAWSMPEETGSELLAGLLERWFEIDSGAAQVWVRAHPEGWRYFDPWVEADPESALRAGMASTEWWAIPVVNSSLDKIYGKDVAAKLAAARGLPPGSLRDTVLGDMMANWAKQDPEAAFAALPEISSDRSRKSARDAILKEWANRDPAGALAKLSEILPTLSAGVESDPLIIAVAESVAAKDPRLALEWLKGIPPEIGQAPFVAAAREWAKTEPIAALRWCLDNGVEPARPWQYQVSSWQGGVLAAAMGKAPLETIDLIRSLPDGPERQRLMECAFKESLWHIPPDQLFGGDNPAAWQLFNQLSEDAQVASASVLGQRRAAKGDLTDLGAWTQNFKPGQARANAITGAMLISYMRDASQAEKLVATTAPGPDRDVAIRTFANAISEHSPREGVTRALTISDGPMRQEALGEIVVSWLESDPKASRSWLESAADVPAAWKDAWLRRGAGSKNTAEK